MRAKRFLEVVLVCLVLLVLPLMTVLNLPHITNQDGLWIMRGLAAGIIGGSGWRYTKAKYVRQMKDSHVTRGIDQLDRQLAYELQREAGRDAVDRTQATLFTMALRTPERVRQRLVEEYEPGQRTLKSKVTLEVQVPRLFLRTGQEHDPRTSLPQTFPFPILVSPKSRMHDNLDVFDANGTVISTLSYREYLGLAANALRYLLVAASGGKLPEDREKYAALHSVEVDALMEIIKRRNDRLYPAEAKRLDDETERVIGRLLSLDGNQQTLMYAADIVRTLSKNYAIVAPVRIPGNGRFSLSYTRSIIPLIRPPATGMAGAFSWWKQLLRHLLGARPTDVWLQLENAGTSHSYHIRVQGPEGLYLGNQQLVPVGIRNNEPVKNLPGAPYRFQPHYRFRSRLGQPYAHFYGRHFPKVRPSDDVPSVEFRFYEVPPGSDFQAAVAAASAAFLIGLIGFALSHAQPGSDGHVSLGSDAPVLLLAFPGVVASWLGLDKAGARLFDGSLSARVSLVGTVIFSVVASALYIINDARIEPRVFDGSLGSGVSLLGVRKDWWVGLTVLAVVNTLCIAYRCVIRAWRYTHLSQRNTSA